MIRSQTEEDKVKSTFDMLPDNIRAKIQKASVKLSGGPTPVKKNTFTGSGVILYRDDSETWVLTAKHNLFVFNDNEFPPDWSDDLKAQFQKAVKIYYDGALGIGKTPAQQAPISSIIAVTQDGTPGWTYDVMILKSADVGLLNHARNNAVYAELPPSSGYLVLDKKYLAKADQTFVMTGFGNVTDTSENRNIKGDEAKRLPQDKPGSNQQGALQYRITAPWAQKTESVYLQGEGTSYARFDDAIQLNANQNDATAPGDSGGPLFVTAYDKASKAYRLDLIGVATGGDMLTTQKPCPTGSFLRENDICTSLRYCYENGFAFSS